jgi:hypothetical protein
MSRKSVLLIAANVAIFGFLIWLLHIELHGLHVLLIAIVSIVVINGLILFMRREGKD